MHHSSNNFSRAAVVAMAVSVALAACGGDDASSGGDPSGGEAGRDLTIGLSTPVSGPAASAGIGANCGLKAFLEEKNDEGGINGYTFSFIERDNEFDPAKAAGIAREFVSEDVAAVFTIGTAPMEATIPLLEPEGVPLFVQADGSFHAPPNYEAIFGINPEYDRLGAAAARFILDELNKDSAALAYVDPATKSVSESFPAYMAENGGEVLTVEPIAATVNDFTPFAQNLQRSGADVVYAHVLDTQLAALQKASDAIGYSPTWVTWHATFTPSYLELAGDLAEGTYVQQIFTPLTEADDPNVELYLDVMEERCPELVTSVTAQQGWTHGAAIAHAVEQATEGGEELTNDSFVEALTQEEPQSLGLIPALTFNDETRAGATGTTWYQIQDGELVFVADYQELPEDAAA